MMREPMRLPTDCDLCPFAVQWAAFLLNETPHRLDISFNDRDYAAEHFGDIEVVCDPRLSRDAWRLVGPTGSVYSSGA